MCSSDLVVYDPRDARRVVPDVVALGVDPIVDGLDTARLRALLRSSRRAVKALLLDQHVIAGIGNIYGDEILHRARIQPRRPSDSIGPAASARLAESIVSVLSEAIAAGGSTLGDAQYVDLMGEGGSFQDAHRVYGRAGERRHGGWPLRLGAEGTDAVVRAWPIRCSHYDAFRFFTPGARPLNKLAPTLATRVEHEQPGCVHANMDLFKWAMKAQPWVPAELAADAFEVAHDARTVDMRASPYDFSAIGLRPIAIETADGRAEYEAEQRRLAARAEPVRARLIAALSGVLSGCLGGAPARKSADPSAP